MKKFGYLRIIIIAVTVLVFPYLAASIAGGEEYVFSGLLVNPADGNSYLAKMYQGWLGHWKFVLPYSQEQNDGAYFYLFYILLGHFSRITGLTLVWTYHLARIVASIFLMVALRQYFKRIFISNEESNRAYLLAVFGSGLGWVASLFGAFASDFWVAEAFPFLSMYTNPHFPLSLACMIWIFIIFETPSMRARIEMFICGIILAAISPFGYALTGIVIFIYAGLEAIGSKRNLWNNVIAVAFGGSLVVLYYLWIFKTQSEFTAWGNQNNTFSQPLWDTAISFAPALLLAMWGIITIIQRKEFHRHKVIIIWAILGITLMYLPFDLQRRFSIGIFVPLSGLAIIGLKEISNRIPVNRRFLWKLLFICSIPTNIILVLSGVHGIRTHDPAIYLTTAEFGAIEWIKGSAPGNMTILASPEIGLFIPAHSGRKVLYGHPYETINAKVEEESVTNFFSGNWSIEECKDFIELRNVDLVFYGNRERTIGTPHILGEMEEVFQSNEVAIFQPQGDE
jgi:hypothetical protein